MASAGPYASHYPDETHSTERLTLATEVNRQT